MDCCFFPYIEYDDYLNEYYGCHKGILKRIKGKYDPLNVFTFLQGIGEDEKEREIVYKKPTYLIKEITGMQIMM